METSAARGLTDLFCNPRYIHNVTGAKLNYGAGAKNVLAVHVDALHCERGSSLCGTLKPV